MPGATSNANSTPGVDTTARHHRDYYITGGDLVISVENTLFRVHRYFFLRDSAYFREKLPQPPSPPDLSGGPGSSDKLPLILDDASKVDFQRLLWVFYNPKYSLYNASVEEWTSILRLAHRWNFVEVKELAIRELQALSIAPLEKIVLYQKYAVNRDLLQPAFIALTIRDEPITIEEGRELGLEIALQLAEAREVARAPVFTGKKAGNPRSPVNLAGVELDRLIGNVFALTPTTGSCTTNWDDTFFGDSSQGTEGSTSRSANDRTNGNANGHANGNANGHTNGTANGAIATTPKNMFNWRNTQK